jgi:hypothetical protein
MNWRRRSPTSRYCLDHFHRPAEVNGLKLLHRLQQADGVEGSYVFIPSVGWALDHIERAGEADGLPFPLHVHMLRHSTGHALAARGMDNHQYRALHGDVARAVQRYLALI